MHSNEYRMISSYSSDIILSWNDIRTKFGYNLLSEMIGNTEKEVEYHGKEKSRQSQGNCR